MSETCQHHETPAGHRPWCVIEIVTVVI